MYTRSETKCGADNAILPRFDCVSSSNRIRYSLWAPRKTSFDNGRKRAVYSPYNRILLSTSPREFLAAHLYVPTSCFCRFRMVRIIRTSYGDFGTACTSYLTLVIIIAPWKQKRRAYLIIPCPMDRKLHVISLRACAPSIFLD